MGNRIGLRQLRAFHAVMIGGSVTAASERLNLTQPAISKQLAALEHALGIKLFHRKSGTTINPTREGIEFFKAVEATISGLDDLQTLARDIAAKGQHRIRVAATPPLLNSLQFMNAMKAFLEDHSDVHVALEARSRIDIEDWVARRQIDIALALLPVANPALETIPLVDTHAVVALSAAHELAEYEVLTPDLVSTYRLILPSRQPLRTRIDTAVERAGEKLTVGLESSSAITCCRMAASNAGIAICDPFSPTAFPDTSLVVRRWEPVVNLTYGALKLKNIDMDPVPQALLQKMREELSHS